MFSPLDHVSCALCAAVWQCSSLWLAPTLLSVFKKTCVYLHVCCICHGHLVTACFPEGQIYDLVTRLLGAKLLLPPAASV
jgi:hypothetical protein